MHKGHASYAHSKQVEMSLDVTRCLSKSREEYANVMYIHDVIIQGTQQNVGADCNNATSKDVEINDIESSNGPDSVCWP